MWLRHLPPCGTRAQPLVAADADRSFDIPERGFLELQVLTPQSLIGLHVKLREALTRDSAAAQSGCEPSSSGTATRVKDSPSSFSRNDMDLSRTDGVLTT